MRVCACMLVRNCARTRACRFVHSSSSVSPPKRRCMGPLPPPARAQCPNLTQAQEQTFSHRQDSYLQTRTHTTWKIKHVHSHAHRVYCWTNIRTNACTRARMHACVRVAQAHTCISPARASRCEPLIIIDVWVLHMSRLLHMCATDHIQIHAWCTYKNSFLPSVVQKMLAWSKRDLVKHA